MAIILGANTLSAAYDVANSCRLQDSDSSEMSRAIASTATILVVKLYDLAFFATS